MSAITVPNTVQCDAIFLLHGQRVENVFHVACPSGVDAAAIADCASLIGNWVIASYLPKLSDQLTFLMVEAKNLNILNGSIALFNAPANTKGGTASAALPGNVSFCVSLRTGVSGRSFRGRKYIMGVPENKRAGNLVDATWAGDLVTAFNTLITVLQAASKLLVVVSKFSNDFERVIGLATEVTTASVTDFAIDSQRRRLTGRGT